MLHGRPDHTRVIHTRIRNRLSVDSIFIHWTCNEWEGVDSLEGIGSGDSSEKGKHGARAQCAVEFLGKEKIREERPKA